MIYFDGLFLSPSVCRMCKEKIQTDPASDNQMVSSSVPLKNIIETSQETLGLATLFLSSPPCQ